MNQEKRAVNIGAAVKGLRQKHPDLTISKVRYLEDQGLLSLERTHGGYRLFSEDDILRLAEILRLQREQFLPLGVIKERMKEWRAGVQVDNDEPSGGAPIDARSDGEPVAVEDVLKGTGSGVDALKAIESFGLIKLVEGDNGLLLSGDDYQIVKTFLQLKKFGLEPRHLRMFENQAQKESLLLQQILSPQLKNRNHKLRQKSREDLTKLLELMARLKQLALERALKDATLT